MEMDRMKRCREMCKSQRTSGFTIIELSLSLVFIAILSIAVTLVITGAISSYRRGLTLNKINSVGSSLVDELRSTIKESKTSKMSDACSQFAGNKKANCESDGASKLVQVVKRANVSIKGKGGEGGIGEVPVYGAFCTGVYSYVWNSGYVLNDDYEVGVGPAKLRVGDNTQFEKFRLMKVKDQGRKVCGSVLDDNYNDNTVNDESLFISSENGEPEELLSKESGLAIYDLTTSIAEQTGREKDVFYYTSFILGTVQGGVNVNAAGDFCATPEGYDNALENLDYCAINKFNFAAMATGG